MDSNSHQAQESSVSSDYDHDEPSFSRSREKQYRIPPNVRIKRLEEYQTQWKKRLQKSVTGGDSSSEEDEGWLRDSVFVSHAGSQPPSLESLSLERNKKNRERITRLPRPDESVRAVRRHEESDAQKFTIREEARRRRNKASVLLAENLTIRGELMPVPTWLLDRHGLSRYSGFLVPPKEDRLIEEFRVPRRFLSRSYRGSLLSVRRIYDGRGKSAKRKRKGNEISADANGGDPGYLPSGVDDAGSDSELDKNVEGGKEMPLVRNAAKAQESARQETNSKSERAAILAQTMKEMADSSSSSSDDSGSSGDAQQSMKSRVEEENVEASPAEQDLFGELIDQVSKDPQLVLAQVPQQAENVNTQGSVTNTATGVEAVPNTTNRKRKKPSKLESEREKAEAFYLGGRNPKRTRRDVSFEPTGPLQASQTQKRAELGVQYKKAQRMMRRMGFTGRLGAREQGAAEPLIANKNRGRSGIGAVAVNQVDLTGHGEQSSETEVAGKRVKKGIADAPIDVDAPPQSNKLDGGIQSSQITKAVGTEGGNAIAIESNGEGEHLDDDDEYETVHEDKATDNARRAILIDADALVRNSSKRRIQAFQNMVNSSDFFRNALDVESYFQSEKRDLSDSGHIMAMLEKIHQQPTTEKCKELQKSLDEAYKTGEPIDCDQDILKTLRTLRKGVFFGLFHRGSRTRLDAELAAMNLNAVFGRASVSVKDGDPWPYIKTWQDLLCHVGVRAPQSVLWLQSDDIDGSRAGGLLVSTIIDAQCVQLKSLASKPVLQITGLRNNDVQDVTSEPLELGTEQIWKQFLRVSKPLRKRRRVLTIFPDDGLWYSALEEARAGYGCLANHSESLIRFHHSMETHNLKWISEDQIIPLGRKYFRKIKQAGFHGMFEPDDVENL